MDSETTVERGYADLTMIVRPERRHLPIADFLFEFKFAGLPEAKVTGEAMRQLSNAEVKALPAVQSKLVEAQARLEGYHQALQARYGERLRLRTYAVVALGFERLVWEEI